MPITNYWKTMKTLYTSESVCSGHPDKICDQISDAILDEALRQDSSSRVAVETLVGKNICVLAGEVTSKGKLKYEQIARNVIQRLGYINDSFGFSDKSDIKVYIHNQSPEIAQGVDALGAGDQGIMYGYACCDTKSYMPLPILMAHQLAERIDEVREKRILKYLRPDGKTQVSIRYENGKPKHIETIILAVPHSEHIKLNQVKEDLFKNVILPIVKKHPISYRDMNYIINGTGVWHKGGPASDTGLTGRKIVVDTYGGLARIGGGAFSGKDPTKVDRSGAYAARYIAKNIVANKLANRVEVRLAYFIGAKKPVMQEAETFGTSKVSDKVLRDFMSKILDTSVQGILSSLKLQKPIYEKTAAYGHFGRPDFSWEKVVDMIN